LKTLKKCLTFKEIKDFAKTVDDGVLISFDIGYGRKTIYTILGIRHNSYSSVKTESLEERIVKPLVVKLIDEVNRLYNNE